MAGLLPLDQGAPVELLLLGWCAPRNVLVQHAIETQDLAARDDARALAARLFADDDEADQLLADPEAWVLLVSMCPSAVAREPGILAWTAVPR